MELDLEIFFAINVRKLISIINVIITLKISVLVRWTTRIDEITWQALASNDKSNLIDDTLYVL